MDAARQQKEETGRTFAQNPTHHQLSKGRDDGWQEFSECFQGCRAELLLGLSPQTENRRSRTHQAGLYKDLKTIKLGGGQGRSSAYIKGEDGILLRNV